MFAKYLATLLIAFTFVNGDPLFAIPATVGGKAIIDCPLNGLSPNYTAWFAHKAGSLEETIWAYASGSYNTSVYNITVDISAITLTILNVQQSDFSYVYRCMDGNVGVSIVVAQLSTSGSACNGTNNAVNIIQSTMSNTVTLTCDTSGASNSSAVMWFVTSSSYMYLLTVPSPSSNSSYNNFKYNVSINGNNNTLEVPNLSNEDLFICADFSTSPTLDLAIFGTCFTSSSSLPPLTTTAGGPTTTAAGGPTTTAAGGPTTTAAGGPTTTAAGGPTTTAAGGPTTTAAGGPTTTAAGGPTTTAAGGPTTGLGVSTTKANNSDSLKPMVISWFMMCLVIFVINLN